jgi:oligosaccharyltransferase complex subunit alpha (ribophorin I)
MVYTVTVPSESAEASSVHLSVEAVFTEVLLPYPHEISQSENQYVKLSDSHYFFSPYMTESQNTTVILTPNTEIKSFTELSPYSKKKENKLSFGPYQFIEPYVVSPLRIHYMNNKPFAKFSSVIREIEVSHWGNINVEEIFELKHAGAALKGGFSRLDYSAQKPAQSSPSFRRLKSYLPILATNIYYRDQIGNISTSDIIVNEKYSELELEIQPRFPLFGGWQTQFYIGYSVPTNTDEPISPTLRFDGNNYELKFDYFTIFEKVWVEDIEIKVVLPEGCSNIKVKAPNGVEQSWSKRFTYLDTELNGGRPVLTLRAKNLVEEHNEDIRITYTFSRSRMVVEPLMIVISFVLMFFVASLVARIETSDKK